MNDGTIGRQAVNFKDLQIYSVNGSLFDPDY